MINAADVKKHFLKFQLKISNRELFTSCNTGIKAFGFIYVHVTPH